MADDSSSIGLSSGARRMLIAGLLILLVIILFSVIRSRSLYTSFEVKTQIAGGGDSSVCCMLLPYGLVRYSSNGVALTDKEGSQVWNQTYSLDEPVACAGEIWFAVGGRGSNSIFVFGEIGQCGRITTDAPIQDLRISDQGVVAALLSDKDSNYIDLYDKAGNHLASIKASMTGTGYPQAMDISPDGKSLAVSFLKVDTGRLQTRAVLYSFHQQEGEHEVYAETVDGLCPKVEFLANTQAGFFFENGWKVLETGETAEKAAEMSFQDEICSVFTGDQKLGFIFRNQDDSGQYRVEMYDAHGRLSSQFFFDFDYTRVFCGKDSLIVYNDTQAQAFAFSGQKKLDISFDEPVTSIMPSWEQGRYWVAGESSLSEIKVQ